MNIERPSISSCAIYGRATARGRRRRRRDYNRLRRLIDSERRPNRLQKDGEEGVDPAEKKLGVFG